MMRSKRLGFEAISTRVSFSSSVSEKDLRKERYDKLREIALEHHLKTLVTAHHGDDDAEGYFMALMGNGGGELGAAMREESTYSGLTLCRPFLSLSKSDLLLSLTLHKHTDFFRDRLDEGRKNRRALVRYELIPGLSPFAPNLKTRLARFAKIQGEQKILLDRIAKSLIIWRDDLALIPLAPKPDAVLLVQALWQVLKKFSNGKDIRASSAKIFSIAQEISHEKIHKTLPFAGLDPSSNGFNLKDLEVKKYQFPGVVVLKGKHELVITRS
jgi:tRNA(Ile)-lysidine synthase TilS/MesJ